MDILKRGTPPSEKLWIGECKECTSILQVKGSEIIKGCSLHGKKSIEPAYLHCEVCAGHGGSSVVEFFLLTSSQGATIQSQLPKTSSCYSDAYYDR
jgi:hypothetical protein